MFSFDLVISSSISSSFCLFLSYICL